MDSVDHGADEQAETTLRATPGVLPWAGPAALGPVAPSRAECEIRWTRPSSVVQAHDIAVKAPKTRR